jgi:Domain of unknown function (DUF4908)
MIDRGNAETSQRRRGGSYFETAAVTRTVAPKAGVAITRVLLATFVVVGLGGYDAGVAAERRPPLRIGHYSTVDGSVGFVFDRLGTPAKLRFDGSEEILALTPQPASRDSVWMVRDDGRYVLRVSPEGGISLYPSFESRPTVPYSTNGRDIEVVRDDVADALAIAPATRSAAYGTAIALGEELTGASAASIGVVVEAKQLDDASSAWSAVADALKMAGIAFKDVLADPLGRRAVASDLDRIVIRDGGHAAVTLADRALTIEIDAATPVSGRPSSGRIKAAMGDLLVLPGPDGAPPQSLRIRQLEVHGEERLIGHADSTNKVCDTSLAARLDWSDVSTADIIMWDLEGYCNSGALGGIRRVCTDKVGKEAVKMRIKRVTCGFAAQRAVSLDDDGTLTYKTNFHSADVDFVLEYLQNHL